MNREVLIDVVGGALSVAALLHLLFAILEFLPPGEPWMLRRVRSKKNRKRPSDAPLLASQDDRNFVSTILRNVAAYNLIVVAGFVWAAYPWLASGLTDPARTDAGMLFGAGALVAGLVGLSISKATIVQAFVGFVCLVGCALLRYPHLIG